MREEEENHLKYVFYLTGKKGELHISMHLGMNFFHGSLLTHNKMHNGGEVMENGCCLNFQDMQTELYSVATLQQ